MASHRSTADGTVTTHSPGVNARTAIKLEPSHQVIPHHTHTALCCKQGRATYSEAKRIDVRYWI